ncbi:hypothetical protein [Pseudomonas sp. EA_105y_Pfl2_R69]|uniref:hypothetical protein n=1 Tax=Pseudomonas sp. EA_105y_Pfl2_R69 TaxID=3088683 RepID=UPI0030D7DEB5
MKFPLRLGKDGEYTLDERAFKHIVDGEFVTRIDRASPKNQREDVSVLAGGLHTYRALHNFLQGHPKLVPLDAFDPIYDEDWHYVRELQNKVLTVKLPRILFNKSAANITQMPESYYKSGYLWKTLFPKSFSNEDIISSIDQALQAIDIESSGDLASSDGDYHIIGYANQHAPMTALRIQIQLQGNSIRSAFPSWSQPWTGNNGKPFSHSDSISFIISQSTERASAIHYKRSKIFVDSRPNYEALKLLTPNLLIAKTIPAPDVPHDEWRKRRLDTLTSTTNNLTTKQLSEILLFLEDHAITKEGSFQQQWLYTSKIAKSGNPLDFNACQISQNIYECFYLTLKYDNLKGTNHFLKCMRRYLSASIIHSGGMHLFELKKLHKLFMIGAIEHHQSDSVKIFIEALAESPSRAATYHEFNLNTYIKKHDEESMMIIGRSGFELPILPKILVDFIALNLGENYLASFDQKQRQFIAENLLALNFPPNYVKDALMYFTASDFDFFGDELAALLSCSNKEFPDEKSLDRLIRDYHRMQVMYRQRVVLEDVESYHTDPFDLEFMSPDYCDVVIQKHKRDFIVIMHQRCLESIEKLCAIMGLTKLGKLCNKLSHSINKEGVPLPNAIPDYIPSWMTDSSYGRDNNSLDISTIFES